MKLTPTTPIIPSAETMAKTAKALVVISIGVY
jgi:hypothetical protein